MYIKTSQSARKKILHLHSSKSPFYHLQSIAFSFKTHSKTFHFQSSASNPKPLTTIQHQQEHIKMRFQVSILLPALLLPSTFALPSTSDAALEAREAQSDFYAGTCATCKPFPGENLCDITTSCTYVWGHGGASPAPLYCACRHGYRADNVPAGDSNAQWRLDWPSQEGRVFVRPGLTCNTLCDNWQLGKDGCKEVKVRSECL